MEVAILEEKKNTILVELIDEDHTFCNALKDELVNDKAVKAASYRVEHPLIKKAHIVIETDGSKSAKDALKDACKKLTKAAEKFADKVKELK